MAETEKFLRFTIKQRALFAPVGALLRFLSGCGGGSMPGLHLGSDEGGSTYSLDALPFVAQRADGTILTGNASVRLLRIEFLARNAKRTLSSRGGFTLDRGAQRSR